MITKANGPVFLIVVQDILVGQDISLTISDDIPDAKVIVVSTLAQAEAALKTIPSVEAAFLAVTAEDLARSPLTQMLLAGHCKIVLMGPWGETQAHPAIWRILQYPFRTDDVRSLISEVRSAPLDRFCGC